VPVLCIIQPGKIGDIIILLPVAKWYADRGYQIVWPILEQYVNMFQPAVPYVKFLPVKRFSYELVKQVAGPVDKYIDTYFGFSDKKDLTKKWRDSGIPFDVYKYELAEVPFEEKFKLEIVRNIERETNLFKLVVKHPVYLVLQEQASDCFRSIPSSDDKTNYDQIVKITNMTDSIFDWLMILEKASAYRMIDSSFVNLINQMLFKVPGIRYWKPNRRLVTDYPFLNNNWTTET
jgi:hypothetical protein